MIENVMYKLGEFFFNPLINKHYVFLKETEKWSYQQLIEYQQQKMVELIRTAYENSDFYRDLYNKNGIQISTINTIEDLKKLPIVKKEDLIKNNKEIHVSSKEKIRKAKTSGTSGQSLSFYRNLNWDARNRASIKRGYSWYGVKPWHKNGYLWGFNFDLKERIKTKILDSLQNRFRLFSLNPVDSNKFLKKLKRASYISGYSSVIYELAKTANNSDTIYTPIELKMVKGTSEKIFDSYQEEVEKAFGTKIISEYGSAETGIISFECPYGRQHVFMENVIIENDNEGDIIVTNLVSQSFPIIRYRLGDYVSFEAKPSTCPCGMKHQVITEIIGRVGKLIQGHKDKYPSLTLYYVFKNLASQNVNLNYVAVQKEKGLINLYIEQKMSLLQKNKLLKECEKYYHDDLSITLVDNHKIKSVGNKKKDFISYL